MKGRLTKEVFGEVLRDVRLPSRPTLALLFVPLNLVGLGFRV